MKEQDNIFYVYAHYRASGKKKNEIFYVGKGCGARSRARKSRNKNWHDIVNKYDYYIEILYDNLDEQTSFQLEVLTIARYGRKDLGLGPLVNLTDGGEGVWGIQGKPVKNQFGETFPSIASATIHYNLGSDTSIGECCNGLSLSAGVHPILNVPIQWKFEEDATPFTEYINPRSKPVKNQFGDEFSSLEEAAAWCGLKNGFKIGQCVLGARKSSGKHPGTKEPLQWKLVSDETPFDVYVTKKREDTPVKNQFGDIFNHPTDAAEWCNLKSYEKISECCRGNRKSAGTHPVTKEPCQWKYAGDPTPFEKYVPNSGHRNPVENQFGDIFQTAAEAAKWCGLAKGSSISSCCIGSRKSAGKHPVTGAILTWKYAKDKTSKIRT